MNDFDNQWRPPDSAGPWDGPWRVTRQNGDGLPEFEGMLGVSGPEQTNSRGNKFTTYIAQCISPENAPMIAAAPDMLRALKCAMKISDLWLPGPDCDPEEATALQMMAAMFEEAIQKATGQSE